VLLTVTRREQWTVSLAALGIVALYVINAFMHGAIGASRNDDWAYLRVAFRLAETGEFSLDGWTQMTFVGQALLAWPIAALVGPSIASMQLLVAFLAWIGVVACYLTLRTFSSTFVAALSAGVLLVGPMFGSLATSFMTDVPSFSFQMLTLLAASRLIQEGWSRHWFAAMCTFGLLATSIREYGLIVFAVCSITVWSYCRPAGPERALALAGVLTSVTAILALLAWRSQVPNGDPNGVPLTWIFSRSHAFNGLRVASSAVLTLSLLIAPCVVFALSRRTVTRIVHAPRRTVLLIAAWAAVGLLSRLQLVGNYVGPNGSYAGLVLGTTPPLLGPNAYAALRWTAFAALLGILLFAGLPQDPTVARRSVRAKLEWFRMLDPPSAVRIMLCGVAVGLAGAHLLLLVTSNAPYFDRYLIVLVPIVVALVATADAWTSSRIQRAMLAALFGGLLLVGMAFVDASAALDGAKWRVGERLADHDFPRSSIDAGFAWFNFHQDGIALQQPGPDRNWWTSFYPQTPVCVTVIAGDDAVIEDSPVEPLMVYTMFGTRYHLGTAVGPSSC
jgi:hypothetical protein